MTVSDVKPTTTDAGALVESDEHSLTVGVLRGVSSAPRLAR